MNKPFEFGVYTLGDHLKNPYTKERIPAHQRIEEIIELAKLAESEGLDVFALGESHQEQFTSQAHTTILGAIAHATKTITLTSGSTVLSTLDPVRVFEDFATLDLISKGRIEIIAGRGSRTGNFDVLGYSLDDYDTLFEEKFDLLNQLNASATITWSGAHRAPLNNVAVRPRPYQESLTIWRAVGGRPPSAQKAAKVGSPMAMATLAGPAEAFKETIDVYKEGLKTHGFAEAPLKLATTSLMYIGTTTEQAIYEAIQPFNNGLMAINGRGFPSKVFERARNYHDTLMVGSVDLIVKKLMHQYTLFGHTRFLAQLDFGGVDFDTVKHMLRLYAREIVPRVRKKIHEMN